MALIWYGMSVAVSQATSIVNYTFTVYFVAELASKLCGLGVRAYMQEGMNVFDAFVTVAGAVEMAVELSPAAGALGSYLLVLRAFRLLRVFRLARSWKSLNRIIQVLLSSVSAVSWLTALLLLFMFIWSLLGMQFFGYELARCDAVEGSLQLCPLGLSLLHDCPPTLDCYLACSASAAGTWFDAPGSPYGGQAYCERFPRTPHPAAPPDGQAADGPPPQTQYWAQVGAPSVPRANFDGMLHAFITVFQILTLDNWADALHSTMAAISPATALYYVGVIIVGVYMVLNLFLAILLDNLDKINDAEEARSASSQGGRPRLGSPPSNPLPGAHPDLHSHITLPPGAKGGQSSTTPTPTTTRPSGWGALDAMALDCSQHTNTSSHDSHTVAAPPPDPRAERQPPRPPRSAAVRFAATDPGDQPPSHSASSLARRSASMLKVQTLNNSFWVTKAVAQGAAAKHAAQDQASRLQAGPPAASPLPAPPPPAA
ncbi:Ion transport protein-domain-containing protein [Haematococcus lacustris]